MLSRRRNSLLIGFFILLASIGTISYVSASGDGRINACANKSTGLIRYIEKGSCKKTEKAISWNKQGTQGAQGTQGVQGNTGKSGTDGSAGASGSKGDSGANGQNFYVVDSTGKDLGVFFGPSDTNYTLLESWVMLDSDAYLWRISPTSYGFESDDANAGYGAWYFKDPACSLPLIVRQSLDQQLPSLQKVFIVNVGATASSGYVRIGPAYGALTAPLPYIREFFGSSCRQLTSDERAFRMQYFSAFADTKLVPLPLYQPPLKIVKK